MRSPLDPAPPAATTAVELIDRWNISAADLGDLLADARAAVERSVDEVVSGSDAGESQFPIVEFADVAAGSVDAGLIDAVRRRGCVVVRNTFDRAEAEQWDAELAEYLAVNTFRDRFFDRQEGASTGSRIWPVYWSRPQVLARQHPRMASARRFLNGIWRSEADGVRWFDPEHDIAYPDRIRRREPGAVAKGLSMHCDAPVAGGWRVVENQRVLAPIAAGGFDAYDPWSAAERTRPMLDPAVESPVSSSVFRTFQGWTALSEMHSDDGVLHVVPIPGAAAYRLLDGLAAELRDGVDAPRRDSGDELLAAALSPIPTIMPGDTVWWHGDLFHSVAPAANETRWGNVMYIGSAPDCERNARYASTLYARFAAGRSPVDFPTEDFEVDFGGRAGVADLNEIGLAQFGLASRPG